MKTKITFAFLLLLANLTSFAQEYKNTQQVPLSQSHRNSEYTHVYRLSNEQLSKLIKHDFEKLDESYLTDFIVAIPNYKKEQELETTTLSPGTYVYVSAKDGKISYHIKQKMTVKPFVAMPNGKFEVLLKDVETEDIVTNAQVYVKNKQLKFDSKTLLYKGGSSVDKKLVRIHYKGVDNYFSVEKEKEKYNPYKYKKTIGDHFNKYIGRPIKRLFEGKDYYQKSWNFTRKHNGYMVFDKPKYRPNDTVNIKAWITNKKGKPIKDKEILVRIDEEDEPLGIAKAYRKGGFTFSFQLVDSLDLYIDDDYEISFERLPKSPKALEEANDDDDFRRIFIKNRFDYEDYELRDVNLLARCNEKFYRGDSIEIFVQAKDENDLTIPDGRVNISVTVNNIHNVIDERTFIPDSLWLVENYRLDAEGETKITIPAHIFPKANVDYSVEIKFLNSDNQWDSENLKFEYLHQNEYIKASVKDNNLVFSYFKNGQESSTDALLKIENTTKTENKNIQLPYKTSLDAQVISYFIETNTLKESFQNSTYFPTPQVNYSRTADSLFISIKNEKQLPYWYTLYVNGKEQESGNGNTSDKLNRKFKTDKLAVLKLNYEFAGKIKSASYEMRTYGKKTLNVKVNSPRFVSPGQTFDVEALVTDIYNNPQVNVDLTAFAPTSKFKDEKNFFVPYFGKNTKNKTIKPKSFNFSEKSKSDSFSDFSRWFKELNLTENEYYKFLNTSDIYTNTETIAADKAEIAPFVVKKGKILPVHILYIDEQPVFFSKATQLNRYSFNVTADRPHKISMRTNECIVTLDSVIPIMGKKLILSVSANSIRNFSNFRVISAPDSLSNLEMDHMSYFMLPIENTFRKNYAWIEDSQRIYLLNPTPENNTNSILAGPLKRDYSLKFNLYNMFSMDFPLLRNYTFQFEPNLLRQTSISGRYPFTNKIKFDVPTNLSDTVFHKQELENWYENLIDLIMYNDIGNVTYSRNSTDTKLRIEVSSEDIPKGQTINSVIIYPYENIDTVIYYQSGGRIMFYNNIQFEGKCRIVFLLKNKQFFSLENVDLNKFGLNFVRTGKIIPQSIESDSIARNFYYDIRRKHRNNIESQFKSSSIKTAPLFTVYDPATFNHGVSGNVTDNEGNPLIGAIVLVKGTMVGLLTDINGNFQINVPSDATLVFYFLGYATVEKKVGAQSIINVVLEEDTASLNEVVVTAFGTSKKEMYTGSVSSVQANSIGDALSGRSAGLRVTSAYGAADKIRVRGATSIMSESSVPLIIIDGIPYEGNMEDLNPEDIMTMNILKDGSATGIYGARAMNGVIVITTSKLLKANGEENTSNSDNSDAFSDASVSLRKNFRDVAFWQPTLKTDKNGKAKFSVTMPDDISRWNAHFIAMGNNAKTGYTTMDIKSFKSLTATLSIPRFAITNDSIYAIGKISNYMGVEQELQRQISINGEKSLPEKFIVNNYKADTIAIHAVDVDTMNIIYSFIQQNGYSDGEERRLPIFPQGVKETEGNFYVLEGDSSIVFHPKQNGGEVTFRVEGSPLPDMLKEIEHIRKYEYLCNEQLASKLKALLMEKRVRSYLNVPFDGEENIKYIIKKLTETKLNNGFWGWWPKTDMQIWISRHAIEALYIARQDGYQINIDFQTYINDIMLRFPNQSVQDQINSLQLLITLDAKPNFEELIAKIEKKIQDEKITNQTILLELMRIKQQKGINIDTEELLNSKRKNMFGAIYWGKENSRSLFDNSTRETLLAYRILKADTAKNHENTLKSIRQYFFNLRKNSNWRNIYESSLILETILPDLLKESDGQLKTTIVKYSAAKDSTITNFPVSLNSASNQTLKIEKKGTAPVYVTTYQQHWNKNPERVDKEFIVNTYFENKDKERVDGLIAGQPITLIAEVTATADAEYVMIEIPIPAGCSYFDDSKNMYNRYDYYRVETHREQFKNKTAIFCEKMNEGKHTFKIELMPRFGGKYTLNPAKAEMMYFPVFYGREDMKQIEIK